MGDIGSRDESSVVKYNKYGVNVILNDSIGWIVDRGIDYGFCKIIEVEINISKVIYVWRLMIR